MVHTRHSRDVVTDSPPIFLTLGNRKSQKSISHAADLNEHDIDSDQSGTVCMRKGQSVLDEKVVESRLRPRTGPSRSYNYVFVDSSDDEMTLGKQSRIKREKTYNMERHENRRRLCHVDVDHTSDDEEEGQDRRSRWHSTRSRNRHQISTLQQRHHDGSDDDDVDDDDEEQNGDVDDHDGEDINNSAVRRSSRLKKKPFRFRASGREDKQGSSMNLERGKRCHSDENSNQEFVDMYSRVKRARTKKTVEDTEENSASNSDGTNDDEKNDSEAETQERRSYSLRERRPRTQLYAAPAIEAKKKKLLPFSRRSPPPRRVLKQATYCSPAHRRPKIRKRQAFHGNSSSTSSDSDSGTATSDEQHFNRRKAKSLAKARSRICPLNFSADMISSSGILKDRVRTGASLADVDPMEIDKSITFDSVGGLQNHIMKLKEMVVFPLLYPEFYNRFKVAPSRGVLFHGPPGTGKTLVARALANEFSHGDQRVAFFMRKGADCLSKWVGEAERQLRLLFDKAFEMRPSIIFFDEIDGLAPVRSSRQDQIHSSIVSTLLALMDGIDSRGEIVVIGATNRIDAIDPALRRPGRFDREFYFPLPDKESRKKILKIHTKNWNPGLRDDFLVELAEKCAGYCGADLKCLVTEASQNALRRHYPQIYTTSDKLQLDVSSIKLTASDFMSAIMGIVPAASRAAPNPAMALEECVRPLLSETLMKLNCALAGRFPYSKFSHQSGSTSVQQDGSNDGTHVQGVVADLPADEEDNAPSIMMPTSRGNRSLSLQPHTPVSFLKYTSNFPVVFRPRMLVSGAAGQGQSVHLAPAALHLMEHLSVHVLNSATLFASSARMPEEACANVFHEAKRTAPSVIYIPYINELWGVVSDSLRVTFLTLIRSMSSSTPVLLFATSETTYEDLDDQLKQLFNQSGGEVLSVDYPAKEDRRRFFTDIILNQTCRPPPTHRQAARRVLEPLAKAPPPEPRKLTEKEQHKLKEQEEDTLRELRIFLRDMTSKLLREKKFGIFTKPVDRDEIPDYYDIIKKPMDLSTVMSKIDLHKYTTASAFLDDIFLICSNALEYNPDHGPTDRAIRHRACALRDMAQSMLKADLDPDFERLCQEIAQSRKRRGVDSSGSVPAFYHTRPVLSSSPATFAQHTNTSSLNHSVIPEGNRYSRRVRGMDVANTLPLEVVEKSAQVEKSLLARDKEPSSSKQESAVEDPSQQEASYIDEETDRNHKKIDSLNQSMDTIDTKSHADNVSQADCQCPTPSSKNPSPISGKSTKGSCDSKYLSKKASMRKKCPWLATRRRRRHHSISALKHDAVSPGSDGEHVSGDESMDTELSPNPAKSVEKLSSAQQCRRELSPVSAANPANVNVSSHARTRSNSDNVPALQPEPTPLESRRQVELSTIPASVDDGPITHKSGAARCLEMDLMTVVTDSGISSESNGDSRDSLDHNSNHNSGSVENQEHVEDGSVLAKGAPLPRTRSRTQTALQLSAHAALDAEIRSVSVDKDRLGRLLDTVVRRTDGFTVEKLQYVYSTLSCTIYNHRHQFDKTQLVQEMADVVDKQCQEAGHLEK